MAVQKYVLCISCSKLRAPKTGNLSYFQITPNESDPISLLCSPSSVAQWIRPLDYSAHYLYGRQAAEVRSSDPALSGLLANAG